MSDEKSARARVGARRRALSIVAVAVVAAAVVVVIVSIAGSMAGTASAGVGATTMPSSSGAATTDGAGPSSSPPPSGESAPVDEVDDVDRPGPRETAAPVPIDGEAAPQPGFVVSLAAVEAVEGQAAVPGEVAGPALQVTLSARNDGAVAVDTATLIVNVSYGADRIPANILVSPRENLPETIGPGETAQGVFTFSVPADQRGDVRVEIDLNTDSPVVVFAGAV